MVSKHSLAATSTLLFAPIVTLGCGGAEKGYESPQAAFDATAAAYRARDWGTVFDAMTPEAQNQRIALYFGRCAMPIGQLKVLQEIAAQEDSDRVQKMIAEAKVEADKFSELVTDHKLSVDELSSHLGPDAANPEEGARKLVSQLPDKRAFFIDYQERTKTFKAGEKPTKEESLTNLTIEGDTARGTVEGALFGQPSIKFKKIEGRWFVDVVDASS